MTLEIRQMVIKSDIARRDDRSVRESVADDDAGDGCDDARTGPEALRSGLLAELERLRER